MSIAGECGSYMPALLVTIPLRPCRSQRHFKEYGAQKLRLQYQQLRYTISSAIHICLKYNN